MEGHSDAARESTLLALSRSQPTTLRVIGRSLQWADAEDVVQQAMLEVWCKIQNGLAVGSVEALLVRIATCRARDHRRNRNRSSVLLGHDTLDRRPWQERGTTTPPPAAPDNRLHTQIDLLQKRLRGRQQRRLLDHLVRGGTLREFAEVRGLPQREVSRVLKRLIGRLEVLHIDFRGETPPTET